MEPYSSNGRDRQEDSQDYRSRSSPHLRITDPPFTLLLATNTSADLDSTLLKGVSHPPALGLNASGGGQTQCTESQAQISSSQFSELTPQLGQYSRYSSSHNASSSLAPQTFSSQATVFQTWDYPVSGQAQPPSSPFLQKSRLDHIDPVVKAQYGPGGEQQSLQTNMSIMTPQYFSGVQTSYRSANTWPVLEQQQPYVQEPRYPQSFDEKQLLCRPQSTLSTSPRMMSMSLPAQRESRQLHEVRRDTKTRFRRERSRSNSHNASLSTTPEAIPRSLAPDMYFAGQPAFGVAQARMPTQGFSSSPQVSGSQQPDVYEQPYQVGMANYSDNYFLPYSTAPLNPSISSFSSRQIPASAASSPDLGTYYRQPSASRLVNSQNQALDASADPVRVLLTRPKPQCWDHGCNGRAFSTFSNLLRHQREKNGVASKPSCPNCGAEFTRTTARNGHMAHEKCKKA